MEYFNTFNIDINQKKVFNAIQCYEDSPLYEEIVNTYNDLLKKIEKVVKPIGIIKLENIDNDFRIKQTKKCNHIFYCLVTIGENISNLSKDFFDEGEYLKGMLLDAMADELLFSISTQFYDKVKETAKKSGLGLTVRLSPGECVNNIPLEYNSKILNKLRSDLIKHITITDSYMFNPIKTLCYFYGADESLDIAHKDHDCSLCSNKNCNFRNAKIVIKIISGLETHIIYAEKQSNLLKALIDNKIYINSPCNGLGTCGKCKIKALEGTFRTNKEKSKKLTDKEIEDKIYLACSSYIIEDCVIELVNPEEDQFKIITNYIFKENNEKLKPNNGIIKIENFIFHKEELNDGSSITKNIEKKLNKNYNFSLDSLRKLSTLTNNSINSEYINYFKNVNDIYMIIKDNYIIDVFNSKPSAYGIGIDIGTTTIAFSLIDLIKKKVVRNYSLLNLQRKFGADVISRIQYSINGGLKELNKCIIDNLFEGINELCNIEGKSILHDVYSIVVAGNTTMINFLLSLPCDSMACLPFSIISTTIIEFNFSELFKDIKLNSNCNITILPNISAFVGSDIVSGLLHCDFDKSNKVNMLLDIGTNGEIVIGNSEKIICTATAAGPAFEAANIACGTGSINGAIYDVTINNGKFNYKTIGNKLPLGICGSGLIDIVSESIKEAIIDNTGLIDDNIYENRYINIAVNSTGENIFLNQKDVRELQLAKSAIKSGLEIIIKEFNCSYDDIQTVYLAGGFGNNINIENAIRIGMIGKELEYKVKLVGNSSLGGTVDYLLNDASKIRISNILKNANYINIAEDKNFNDLFIENMTFGE